LALLSCYEPLLPSTGVEAPDVPLGVTVVEMYSYGRESRVNVTGPSFVRATLIIAPNLPSIKYVRIILTSGFFAEMLEKSAENHLLSWRDRTKYQSVLGKRHT
jgi:hypothetical protein